MKTIDESVIKKHATSAAVYKRGHDIFERGDVYELEMTDNGDGTYLLNGEVLGTSEDFYEVRATIAPWEKKKVIHSMSCSCKAFSNYDGLCKHLVALLLEYNYQYGDEDSEIDEDDIGEAIERFYLELIGAADKKKGGEKKAAKAAQPESDADLKNLMDYYVLQDRNLFCQEYGNGDVRLEPTLHLEPGRESLDLKIGVTQMYVVKDIGDLIDNIKQMRYVTYGKKLAFTHSQSAFTRESSGMVQLLLELDSENEYSYRYESWGYGNSQMRRSCTLSPAMLDRLMELYEGKRIRVDDQMTGNEEEMPVLRENPKLPIRIKGRSGAGKGADVFMESIFMTEGSKQWYIMWNHAFYICSKEFYDRTKGFLKLMAQERKRLQNSGYYSRYYSPRTVKSPSFYLSERDFGAFSKTALPVVQDYFDIRIEKLDLSAYEPEEAAFHCYLDKVGSHIECSAKALYGKQEYYVAKIPAKEEAGRDIRSEFQVRSILEEYFRVADDQKTYVSDDEELMLEFLEKGMHELEGVAEIFATDRFKNMRVIPMPQVTTGIAMKGNLLDISWDVEGMSAQEVMDILADYRKKKKYHRLKTGEFLRMDENSMAVLAELGDGLHLSKEQLKNRKAEVPLYRSLYLDSLMKENAEYIKLKRDKEFKTVVREMRSMEDGMFELPENIHAKLRPYQEIGFQWLSTLAKYGFGGILADDMGLGKTLQVLTFLAANPGSHALVVCPASLVYNWEAECQRFYPAARVAAVAGNASGRQMQIEQFEEADILITSYDLLKRDIDFYEGKSFDYVIIDEAQYIKNASTQAAKSVKSLACRCRFALTGTPVENRLGELWSIFEFLMPGYLFSYKRFKEELEGPITESRDEGARKRLSRMIRPFILRRLKKDVLKELPDKVEEVVYARMEGQQEELYRAREKNLLMTLAGQTEAEFKTQKLQILAELTGLRQICCDPALVYENYAHDSAKTKTCLDVVENAVSGGHKLLLFSQFAAMLERLQRCLEERGVRTFLLTGKTNKEERRRLVGSFQNGEADVFLISLKAGGTGLNLTAADMVVHYDPWWNLAAQNQATDRAYRIGQDNKVTVIRLIVKGTIEERILKMQEDKQSLADSVISEDGVSVAGLDKEQLLKALGEQ